MRSAQPRPLDLVLLNSYVAVVDHGGFSAAGEVLHLAQSTISAHIKRLETQVGHALLVRDLRKPSPTPAGGRLLQHARHMLKQSALAWQDINDQRLEGAIRLGIPDDYLVYLPSVLADFEARFPDVELRVQCALSVDLVQQVESGSLDLAVITRQPYSPGGEVLLREPTIWAGAPSEVLYHRSPLPLAVSMAGKCIFREHALAALDAAGIGWRIAYESSSLSGLRSALSAGLAISVMTPTMLSEELVPIAAHGELPNLPDTEIALIKAEHSLNNACQQLANDIRQRMANVRPQLY